jgi:hypothetical protein
MRSADEGRGLRGQVVRKDSLSRDHVIPLNTVEKMEILYQRIP